MLSSFYIQNILLCPTYVLLLDWCLRVELNFMLFFVRITKQNPGKTVYSTAHTNFCVSSRVPHYFNLSAYTDSIRQAKEWSYPWNNKQHFLLQLTGSRGSSFRRQVRTCRSQSVSHWRGVQCQRVPQQVHTIIGPASPFCPCGRLAIGQHHKSWAA